MPNPVTHSFPPSERGTQAVITEIPDVRNEGRDSNYNRASRWAGPPHLTSETHVLDRFLGSCSPGHHVPNGSVGSDPRIPMLGGVPGRAALPKGRSRSSNTCPPEL